MSCEVNVSCFVAMGVYGNDNYRSLPIQQGSKNPKSLT